jgi:HEAT repeat protein
MAVGVETVEQLAALFDNDDAEVRLDAAIALGLTRAATAAKFLRRQLAVEQSPRVREQIDRQLRTLGEAAPEPDKAPAPKKEQPPMRSGW